MEFSIKLKSFINAQIFLVSTIIALSLITYILFYISGNNNLLLYLRIFDVGKEQSIPTYFSILNLLLASIFLLVLYRHNKINHHKGSNYWLFLSILFLFLSLDESISIHENYWRISDYLARMHLLPYFLAPRSWVPFGVLFVVIIGFILLPFYKSLQKSTLYLFLISGIIFVTGAIGFESLGLLMLKTGIVESRTDILYLIRRIFEEGFEMSGIAFFNCVLYREISIKIGSLLIKFS